MSGTVYESEVLLNQYLLFHYGSVNQNFDQDLDLSFDQRSYQKIPFAHGMQDAVGFPVRCVTECVEVRRLGRDSRALDLGCAVGRSSFELARYCGEVIGLDFSRSFINAANQLKRDKKIACKRQEEGELFTELELSVPDEIDGRKITFAVGDALNLDSGLGQFDIVLMANLIDRVSDPGDLLTRIGKFVAPGGQLIVTSPYTWLEEYTPRSSWLGKPPGGTLESMKKLLSPSFALETVKELPFLIREHRRKYQWSSAQATSWLRNAQ